MPTSIEEQFLKFEKEQLTRKAQYPLDYQRKAPQAEQRLKNVVMTKILEIRSRKKRARLKDALQA